MFNLLISCSALAVASFTLVLLRWQPSSEAQLPLMAVLGCLAFLAAGPLVFQGVPALIQLYVSLLPLVFFFYLPAFWFYHQVLIAQSPWQWHRAMLWHLLPLPGALLLGVGIFALPPHDFEQMFFSGEAVVSNRLVALSVAFFLALLTWFVVSAVYVARIIQRTVVLRTRLRDFYSETNGKELGWTVVVAAISVVAWGYGLVVLVVEERLKDYGFSESGVFVLLAVMVWTVCLNGARQRPVFEGVGEGGAQPALTGSTPAYLRSTLSPDDLDRIAAKLASGIAEQKLHLSPELNLPSLSASLGERPQYISQTLSQRLHTTFFDFINQARVEEAQKMLVSTNLSVLDIALACGFNSRSSFYKAFKQTTEQTPSQYRRSQS